ncbi:MAG: cysteine desulfurase [SAR324 cluster bacterium]|nr:cysteine desulfurase [SAR324 cluster bacterium]
MFYLDNAATTSVLPAVLEKSLPYLTQHFGNPSSIHRLGVDAARSVKSVRQIFARIFHVYRENIIFCGSGTEANHLALWGISQSSNLKGNQIIVSSIEHPSVLRTAEFLSLRGFQVDFVRSLPDGRTDISHLETLLSKETRLVSCMAVNNEIGTQQPVHQIGQLVKEKNSSTLFHVDAVQGFTKIPLRMKEMKIDLLSISGHKIGAPKGIGALVSAGKIPLSPVVLGGGQEQGFRSGTENVFGIIAFGEAACLGEKQRHYKNEALIKYKNRWLVFLKEKCPRVKIYQSPYVLPHYLNISVPPIPAEVFLHHLEAEGIFVSTGSACSSKKTQISHVLKAVGLDSDVAKSIIRLSFSEQNLEENQDELFRKFSSAVQQLEMLL